MAQKDPLKIIKEHRNKGYIVEISMDSVHSSYSVSMFTPKDVKKFSIPLSAIPIQQLHNAVRGL